MKVWLRRAGRPPGQVRSRLFIPLNPIKIRPPNRLRTNSRSQSSQRNRQFRRPALLLLVQEHRSLHAALKICKAAGKNIEIDPHPIGTHFKLPIVPCPRGIGLEKRFRHIAVPEVIAPSVAAIGVLEYIQLPVAAFKSQIQCLRSPEDANFGFSLLIRIFPLPVGAKTNWLGPLPIVGWMPGVKTDLAGNVAGHNLGGGTCALRWRRVLAHHSEGKKQNHRFRNQYTFQCPHAHNGRNQFDRKIRIVHVNTQS